MRRWIVLGQLAVLHVLLRYHHSVVVTATAPPSSLHSSRRTAETACEDNCGDGECGMGVPSPEDNVQTFYYPWYGTEADDGSWVHWRTSRFGDPDNNVITSPYFPRLGPYSTRAVIDQHMEWIRDAGIGVVITSWWGVESFENARVWDLLHSAHRYGRKVAFYIEPYAGGYIRTPTRTAETARDDVKYLIDTYGCHSSVYRIDERPVILFFAARAHLMGDQSVWKAVWDELHDDPAYNPVVIAHDVNLENRILPGSWDGGHEYGAVPAVNLAPQWADFAQEYDAAGKIFYFTVSPGFHRHRGSSAGEENVIDREDGDVYTDLWQQAIAAAPLCPRCKVVITSFNEWHEGTMIEPAVPFALPDYTYQDYEGAFGGLSGDEASFSYLNQTRVHSDAFLQALLLPSPVPPSQQPSEQPTPIPTQAPTSPRRVSSVSSFSPQEERGGLLGWAIESLRDMACPFLPFTCSSSKGSY